MAKVTHSITIEFTLEDLSDEERQELYEQGGFEGDYNDEETGLPTVEDVTVLDLFDAVSLAIETSEDMWGGTGCYCKVTKLSALMPNGTHCTNLLEKDDWAGH